MQINAIFFFSQQGRYDQKVKWNPRPKEYEIISVYGRLLEGASCFCKQMTMFNSSLPEATTYQTK